MDEFRIRTDNEGRTPTKYVDDLSDEDLSRLNNLLPWQCFTLDSNGRRFGKQASANKRNLPQVIPDRRITELNYRFPLRGLSVLEVGCFEGVHTIALAGYGARVVGIDSRIENVAKTMVRTWSFGFEATVFKCDVELEQDFAKVPEVDITHHMGVLYHLVDPVTHLQKLAQRTRKAILLDTHYAREDEAVNRYEVGGISYRYKHYREGGREEAFAGMYDHAKWLPLETLVSLLKSLGFPNVDVAELRDERNGARVLIFADRGE
jgi:tRNA (mo5U34)-methyltransferase